MFLLGYVNIKGTFHSIIMKMLWECNIWMFSQLWKHPFFIFKERFFLVIQTEEHTILSFWNHYENNSSVCFLNI